MACGDNETKHTQNQALCLNASFLIQHNEMRVVEPTNHSTHREAERVSPHCGSQTELSSLCRLSTQLCLSGVLLTLKYSL